MTTDYHDALAIPRGGAWRMSNDDMDRARKARHERSDESWAVAWTRRFLDHLDEQAEAHAELVDGSA